MGRVFLDLNWASTVINTLLIAFFVIIAGAIFIGVYGARTLGKRELAVGGTPPLTKEERQAAKAAKKEAKAAEKAKKVSAKK